MKADYKLFREKLGTDPDRSDNYPTDIGYVSHIEVPDGIAAVLYDRANGAGWIGTGKRYVLVVYPTMEVVECSNNKANLVAIMQQLKNEGIAV